ncbi:MAG: MOSC domain-containing protein [Pseudomonadota bacterium]
MPALMKTDILAEVVWLGTVGQGSKNIRSEANESLTLSFEGVAGEAHYGAERASCSRVTSQHPKGTRIRNVRQLSVLSQEDLDAVAAKMGLERLDPRHLGATLILKGIPDFTHVPPSARIQGPDGATLVVDMENRPCHLPAREIEKDLAGFGARFKAAAEGRRGVTAWVEREGQLALGDKLSLHIPDQPSWAHLQAVRAGNALELT